MPLDGLILIGESINDSVPSTQALFDSNDISGIVELARFQAKKGAQYIDVNVGRREPEFMTEIVTRIQDAVSLPLSIDTPDPDLAAAGLKAYRPEKANNHKPILNSISQARLDLFNHYAEQPFIPIILTTEGVDEACNMVMNKTAEATLHTAEVMLNIAREKIPGVPNHELIFDPGISPIGSDSEGNFRRLMATIQGIHENQEFKGVNMCVGLSNFTVMLPSKTADGSLVKGPLESAFLSMAMPLGFNMVIGSVKRKYSILKPDHPAMRCLHDILELEGFDAIMRLMNFYS